MQLGAMIPQNDIGGSAPALRSFAAAAEEYGYDYLRARTMCWGSTPLPAPTGRATATLRRISSMIRS